MFGSFHHRFVAGAKMASPICRSFRAVKDCVKLREFHSCSSRLCSDSQPCLVDAIVNDVQTGLEKQSHVFVGTGQYSDREGSERVLVTSMTCSPSTVKFLSGSSKPEVLFNGYLAPDDIDTLEDRLSKLRCSLYSGEVDALRRNSGLIAFSHTPDVTVLPLSCLDSPERQHDVWQWLTVARDSLQLCKLRSSSDSGLLADSSKLRSIPLSMISDVQVQLESVEWEYVELQLRLSSGEVVTLLRMDLNDIMDELIDTESLSESDQGSTAAAAGSSSNGGADSCTDNKSQPSGQKTGEDAVFEELESVLDSGFGEDEIEKVNVLTGRVKPELAIVMSTEWVVKLAARLCLSCHQQGYPVTMRLPAVLRAECNKWVEYRNEMWMSSRRSPVS